MLTITQLEYLVAVERLRHFGKAAKACHVSQPSLSMQIQKAEDLLGFAVFDRLKKPVLPTEKGIPILEQARAVLREHARLVQIGRDSSHEVAGSFRLGIIPTLAPYVLPLFLADFVKRYPKVKLDIDELKTVDIMRALRDDSLDGGILATPLHEPGLKEQPLFYEPFHLYLNARHPLQERKRIRESDLVEGEIWLLKEGHCFRDQVLSYCGLASEGKSVLRDVRFEGSNFETLRNLVRATGGYTLLPHLCVLRLPAEERARSVRSFEQPVPTREIALVYRREQWKSSILKALEETIIASVPAELRDNQSRRQEVIAPFL
jgi:LysR family hydrogen peroxide-inducible transcriptional activator